MSDKQETISDIIAKMRGLVEPGETLEHTYELLNGLAVRIEAAHKREVDALTAKLDEARHCWKVWSERADELKNKCDEQYAKLKTIGNGAKMREALEILISACDTFEQALEYDLDGHYDNIPGYVDYAHDFITRVNSARAVLKDTKGGAK